MGGLLERDITEYGELHAERDAFAHLTEDAAGAEMYVTLEPCCHYGKQPPCVNAIIEHKISRVYVGSDDPNALVSGKGYQILRDAGIEVITHVLKEECDSLNPVFFHYIVNKTPYVVMKYAMTMDGKIATYSGKSKWITGEEARAHVMEQRNALTGIMVGSETVIKDDPALTCRRAGGRNIPENYEKAYGIFPGRNRGTDKTGGSRVIAGTSEDDTKMMPA